MLYLRYNVYLLYLLSCHVIGFCLFNTYFTWSRSIYSLPMNLHKHQLYLLERHSESFKIWSAIIRINTEGKSSIMKLGPVYSLRVILAWKVLFPAICQNSLVKKKLVKRTLKPVPAIERKGQILLCRLNNFLCSSWQNSISSHKDLTW